ncbi:hypothetical protein ACGFXC_02950 [Streptomyces sp. NPDC048507]|uniref:hypothetical protein n=1 Tax=Streptomyces sp. NPDC048507 TaxID=3365560 RepID=UPI003713F04E
MSEPFPQSDPSPRPEGGATGRGRPGRLLPRGRGARWAAAGVAAAVIVGGGAAAVAVAGHHDGHGRKEARAAGPERAGHERAAHRGAGERRGPGRAAPEVRDGAAGLGGAPKKGAAPAPLPSLAVGQAAEKAAGAVPGGKVESLRAVAQEGGGGAWRAVVLGPDGVRHAVIVSGADGTVTGNTPLTASRTP